MRAIAALSLLLSVPATLSAQTRAAVPPRAVWSGVSARTAAQIRQVEDAVLGIATPDSARAAGFSDVLGWIPTMGEHWVDNIRMLDTTRFDLTQPDHLMFSRIDGVNRLVGAAWAYLAPIADTARPATFDDAPAWHEHPNLAPQGMTLVMLHIWFVPSPDGPFAGHNPNLPFWALDMTPPPAERLHDPAAGPRIRRAALALSQVADTAGLFPVLQARTPALATEHAARRDTIRALILELEAAAQAKDWKRWDAAAEKAALQWDAIRTAYLAAARTPQMRENMARVMDEEEGVHAHEGHVQAPARR